MATEPESERVRWVRYAADCAEHVLHLAGSARPQAEAAIAAARAYADRPCSETLRVAWAAGDAALAVGGATNVWELWNTGVHWSARSAARATGVAGTAGGADEAAWAAEDAVNAAEVRTDERAWQAKRRAYYGLREV